MGRKARAPGKDRDEELQQRLRNGESIVDIAHAFGRTPKFIMREAERVLGSRARYPIGKGENKTGTWTDEEIQGLINLRGEGMLPADLSKYLRRTKASVEKKLQELHSDIFDSTLVQGPQRLPQWLYKSLFKERLINVWDGLIKSEMTPNWRKALAENPSEEWLSRIADGIPESVKKVLGGLQPPTYDSLGMLPPVDTTDAGVYARLLNSRHKLHAATERYVYVGSASRAQGGLNTRVREHTTKSHNTRLGRFVKSKKLERPGRFVTLMTMKMKSMDDQDVLDVRRTVTLAEAILTVWLGALECRSRSGLQDLYQWDIGVRDYTPLCSHNPLALDIVEPRSREGGDNDNDNDNGDDGNEASCDVREESVCPLVILAKEQLS
jgi:hypothetical protein